jgi:hypothetical protein
MSLLFPTNKTEASISTYLFMICLLGPLLLPVFFFERVYFSHEPHAWSLKIGFVLSMPFLFFIGHRTRLLILDGFHPYLPAGSSMPVTPFQEKVGAWIAWSLAFYLWGLVLWAVITVLVNSSQLSISFKVKRMETCFSGKGCGSCHYQVTTDNWGSISDVSLCSTRETWGALRIGDPITVEAYGSSDFVYVQSFRRVPEKG